jgi:pimeloyl-ACP methyl ester carboxylesterase
MVRDVVQVHSHVPAAPEAVWTVVRDFCGAWHPWVTGIREEQGTKGQRIRVFNVSGDDRLYREQQTYFSDSDRVLGYTHLEGIADCEAYDARITISAAGDGGSDVGWSASVRAPDARLAAICQGTQSVFAAGIAALAEIGPSEKSDVPPLPAPVPVESLILGDLPRLAITVTPGLSGEMKAVMPFPFSTWGRKGTRPSDRSPEDHRLCLFLHGIGGGRSNWLPQVQAAGNLMRAAALDLRGYGDSTLGPRQSTVDDYCADILRVAEKLGAKRLVLVGLSFGSWIATSFAMRFPEMLDGLVLSGGCTGMSEAGPDERETFRLSREEPLNAGQVPADFAPAVVKVLAGPEASADAVKKLFDSMAAIPAATYRDALCCFTNPLERFDFAKLAMPVLMMTGEHDQLAPPSEIRSVARRIVDAAPRPDVRFEVIPDAGHVCNVERPEVYIRHLLDFLARLP